MSKTQNFIVLGVVVLIVAAAIGWRFLGASSGADAAAVGGGPGYTITAHDRGMGDPKAKLVLIEYAAPVCPICAQFNELVFPKLKADYIDTGKVYYVLRIFPLRPEDGAVEKMARCLPEDKYFPFIDLMFRNQSKWDPDGNDIPDTHAALVRMGRIAGMSTEKIDECINDTAPDAGINEVAKDGETKYNITGTPTIVVDGTSAGSHYFSYEQLKPILDAALAKK